MGALDKIEEKLGHSPHPAIVAVPLGAWTVTAVADALGCITGRQSYDDAARISLGIGLVGAAGAVVTGLRDYGYIPKERETHAIATRHGMLMAAAASLLTTSLLMRAGTHRPSFAARLLAEVGSGIALYSSWLGGRMVEEFGEAVKPVMEAQDQPSKQQYLEGNSTRPPRQQPASV